MVKSVSDAVNGLVQAKVPADPIAYERATDAVKVAVPVIELALGALERASVRGKDLATDLRRRLDEDVTNPEERMINRLDTGVVVLDALRAMLKLQPTNGRAELSFGNMLTGGSSSWWLDASELPAMQNAVAPFSSLISVVRSQVGNIWGPAKNGDMNLEKVFPREAGISAQQRAVGAVLDAFSPDGGGSDVGGTLK